MRVDARKHVCLCLCVCFERSSVGVFECLSVGVRERQREKGGREGAGETPMLDSKDLLAPFQVCEFAVLFEVVAIAAPSSIRPRTVVDRAGLT
jgi:hypothetical protein